ncbi:amidohydrolase family protein [Kineosporia babensis]|uniref:Amidohydrolase family protein n=1 Tax=Kineosporia babensis TaxID=499548 RepID=A0A9X1NK08_9ACTN|nr:amidohydrolase family protein [Kineosporia babensis]MCD5315578.1 amidohydrolase family protein [Kineosporia babensis]
MTRIIDAHHHLWNPAQREYPWMAGPGLEALRRPFGLTDLRAETTGASVSETILVQTVSSVAETQEFLDVAAGSDGLVAAVVGWVDLAVPEIEDVVAQLRSSRGGELLAGIRHQVEDEPDVDWLLRPEVQRGARAVAEQGLVHDLLVRWDQLPAACALVGSLPEASFVLDHAAKPPIGDFDAYVRWASHIAELAARPNVSCKLSGLFTLGAGEAEIARAVDHLLAVFSPHRLIFGTDWPVSTLAGSYAETVGRTLDLVAELSTTEQAAFRHQNAERTYRVGNSS